MLTIELRFPAGRYHATPWGQSVNEAGVEWPPSPWRLLRTLLALWHRKAAHLHKDHVHDLLHELAQHTPDYSLPTAVHSHTRHYMPQQKTGDTKLIFDAFLLISPEDAVYIHWPELTLTDQSRETLSTLLKQMSYLGRTESWVEARLDDETPSLNCRANAESIDTDSGEVTGEPVRVLSPPTAASYEEWIDTHRDKLLTAYKGKKKKTLAHVMPDSLAEALDRDTADWQAVDKTPPAFAQWVIYSRPRLHNVPAIKPARQNFPKKKLNVARYAIKGHPRMRVRETMRMAEWFRQALIKKGNGMPLLTGHDLPPDNRHKHAFVIPEDRNGDGTLDHILLYVPGELEEREQKALHEIKQLWNYKGEQLDLDLLAIGVAADWAEAPALEIDRVASSTHWVSATPWYCPWYVKPNRDLTIEVQRFITRECKHRKLPVPVVEVKHEQLVQEGSKSIAASRFRFQRKNKDHPPSSTGLLLKLQFEEPYTGPLSLGYGSHFGLGSFVPANNNH